MEAYIGDWLGAWAVRNSALRNGQPLGRGHPRDHLLDTGSAMRTGIYGIPRGGGGWTQPAPGLQRNGRGDDDRHGASGTDWGSDRRRVWDALVTAANDGVLRGVVHMRVLA